MCLLLLCGAAGVAHKHWTEGKREERSALRGEATEGAGTRILIGRPSGAKAVEVVQDVAEEARDLETEFAPEPPPEGVPPIDRSPRVFEVRVQEGQVLSKICASFYGQGKPEITRRVAAYNGLSDANALKVGQKILLPEREVLLAD